MTDREKLIKIKELADAMYTKMQNLTTDTSDIRKAMEEYHYFVIYEYYKEEPVSEELEDITQKITYEGEVYTRCYKDKLDEFACKYPISVPKPPKRYAKYSDTDLTIAVKEGAKWQREHLLNHSTYIGGYHQAEKDLALTWEDIEQISDIINNLVDENFNADDFGIPANKEFYQEVLKRFETQKGK